MSTTSRPSREIGSKGRTVRELLAGGKYSIDYCQRLAKHILNPERALREIAS